MFIRRKKGWEISPREMTPESAYVNRRQFLRTAGLTGLAWSALPFFGSSTTAPSSVLAAEESTGKDAEKGGAPSPDGIYPATRNPKFTLDRPLTPASYVTSYNNFYEFSYSKDGVKKAAQKLEVSPWTVEVTGLVAKPRKFDVDELLRKVNLEERLYRFRCVEAWAMAVPWTGFRLAELLDLAQPLGSAKYVRFFTFNEPRWAPNLEDKRWPWPYYEGLSMAEARNELTLLVTGLYGKALPKQNGAPVRLIVPWKYGFKSIKSVVRIELVEERPTTFWNDVAPHEYGFLANVNPKKPHPRWSQATERMIDTGERRPTLPYNGYGEYVAGLYRL